MITLPNMGLIGWDNVSDDFNNTELVANFTAIDNHDHTSGHGVQIPAGGLASDAVASATIAANAVTTAKVQDGAITDAKMSSHTLTNLSMGSFPSCRVYMSATQAIATGTTTNVLFDSEQFDVGSMHSTSSNTDRLVAPVAGLYLLSAYSVWNASASGNVRRTYIYLNGTTVLTAQGNPPMGASQAHQSCSTVYHLGAGDYVTALVLHDVGSNLSVQTEFAATWLNNA